MAIILSILFGMCLGALGFKFYNILSAKIKKNELKNVKTYLRRGIWENEYYVVPKELAIDNEEEFIVQFELGEVESTGVKSKVEVISMSVRKSQFNTETTFNKIKGMVNGTWMLSSEIEWIDDKAKERNSRIDDILN
jgi:hypothetical protein